MATLTIGAPAMPTLTPDEKIRLLEKRREGVTVKYGRLLEVARRTGNTQGLRSAVGRWQRRIVAIDAAIERLRKEEHDERATQMR